FVPGSGMEENVAAPVLWAEPPAQIIPIEDLVDSFILDDLLQYRGGRIPVDVFQNQEATIEPGGKQMGEIGIQRCQLWVLLEQSQQIREPPHQFDSGAR